MQFQLASQNIREYLQGTDILNVDHPEVKRRAGELAANTHDDIDIAKTVYEYVRDDIAHSADIDAADVPCRASEVLEAGHGICCAKSHLLAALLRAKGIPAGICYQKLRTDENDPASDLILHGLNAIYLPRRERWIRVDARGNNFRVNAQFSLDAEQLAWPVRLTFGEGEDPTIYADPWPEVIYALQTCRTRTELYRALQTMRFLQKQR